MTVQHFIMQANQQVMAKMANTSFSETTRSSYISLWTRLKMLAYPGAL